MPNYGKPISWKIDENGCWICTSHKPSSAGYPQTNKGPIHRLIKPPPKGMVTRHLCGNRLCINPNHLEIGTYKQNTADMIEHGTKRFGELHHNCKITEEIARDIKYGPGTYKEKMEKYNVSRHIVKSIRRGNSWKHI